MPRCLRNFQVFRRATLQIKPRQQADGPGQGLDPPPPCFLGRPLPQPDPGPGRRANALQEGIRIFLCDV